MFVYKCVVFPPLGELIKSVVDIIKLCGLFRSPKGDNSCSFL